MQSITDYAIFRRFLSHGPRLGFVVLIGIVCFSWFHHQQSKSSLELLETDKHADIPRAQTQEVRHETFPKSCQTTLLIHFHGAVAETRVGSFSRVHVSRFKHIDGGTDAGSDESRDKRRDRVARKVVRHQSTP